MKVVAADSAAAILNEKLDPTHVVASAAVLVESPFKEPIHSIGKAIFEPAESSHTVVLREVKLCKKLLDSGIKADLVHLDMSLRGASVASLTVEKLVSMRIRWRGKMFIQKLLPDLRKEARKIGSGHKIDVVAIGKRSLAVRVAELTAGAYAVIYACEKATKEKQRVLLGLPLRCSMRLSGNRVYLSSTMGSQEGVVGYADDEAGVLNKVSMSEKVNPHVEGFKYEVITPG